MKKTIYVKHPMGIWVVPDMSGFRMMCAECGRTHVFNFCIIGKGKGKRVAFQAFPIDHTSEHRIVVEKGEHNFSAYSPDLAGCVATGNTIEETIENMKEAISFHLEGQVAEQESTSEEHKV